MPSVSKVKPLRFSPPPSTTSTSGVTSARNRAWRRNFAGREVQVIHGVLNGEQGRAAAECGEAPASGKRTTSGRESERKGVRRRVGVEVVESAAGHGTGEVEDGAGCGIKGGAEVVVDGEGRIGHDRRVRWAGREFLELGVVALDANQARAVDEFEGHAAVDCCEGLG